MRSEVVVVADQNGEIAARAGIIQTPFAIAVSGSGVVVAKNIPAPSAAAFEWFVNQLLTKTSRLGEAMLSPPEWHP